jgi:hypothetical protein
MSSKPYRNPRLLYRDSSAQFQVGLPVSISHRGIFWPIMTSQPLCFEDLPDTVLIQILDLLPALAIIRTCSHVSKHLRRLVLSPDFWSTKLRDLPAARSVTRTPAIQLPTMLHVIPVKWCRACCNG